MGGRRTPAIPTAIQGLVHPRVELVAGSPRFAGPKATSSRTVGMNSWSSGSWNTMPTRRRISGRCLVDRQPGDRDGATPAVEHAVEVQHQGRLARAVGTEQGHPLALVDPRSTPKQGLVAVGVGEGQPGHYEGRGRHTASSSAATISAAKGSREAVAHIRGVATGASQIGSHPV